VIDRLCGELTANRVNPFHYTVRAQTHSPSVSLFDAMVASAQADEVRGSRWPVRPGDDVVDVALPRRNGAAWKPTSPVALLNQLLQRLARSIGLG